MEKQKRIGIISISIVFCIIVFSIGGYYFRVKSQGNLASDFSLIDLNGNTFWLSDFRGKVVVLYFMATRCGSCRQQMHDLKVIWEKEDYRDEIVLISVDIDPTETAETLSTYAQDFPFATWIWARDTANLVQVFKVIRIPKILIIDQDGFIRFTYTDGVVTDSTTLIKGIDKLLNDTN